MSIKLGQEDTVVDIICVRRLLKWFTQMMQMETVFGQMDQELSGTTESKTEIIACRRIPERVGRYVRMSRKGIEKANRGGMHGRDERERER